MDSCEYQEIACNTAPNEDRKQAIKYVLKQTLIATVSWTHNFLAGLCVGSTTVIIPQLRKEENSKIVIDDEMGSWLYSTGGFAMYPWIFILPLFTKRYGRKTSQIVTSVVSLIIFITLYFSTNPYHILISEVFQGFLWGGNMTIRILILAEYVSIKYRGAFLAINAASYFWGMWFSNAIGTFFYWKNIAIFGIICTLYTFVFVFCPESPYWLASKGRIEECKKSYLWLYGCNKRTEREVQEIIDSYKRNTEKISFIEMFKSKEFYKPVILCVLAAVQYNFSGKVVCSLYILDILKSITSNESTAYIAMLVLDGVTIFGMYFGSLLSRFLKRRTLYFCSSIVGIIFLFIISFYLYLVRFSVVTENNYVTLALLGIYSLSLSCGPILLGACIYGELIPIKYQATSYILTGLTFTTCFSMLLKLTPVMFASFGMHGTFLFYGVTCGLCTIYLYVHMPETKNKTHEDIATFFRGENSKIEERISFK